MRIARRSLVATLLTSAVLTTTALTQGTAVAGIGSPGSAPDGAAPSGRLAPAEFYNLNPFSGDLTPGSSTIAVTDVPELIDDVQVTLYGISSVNSLREVKFTVVSPNGTRVDLIEDACQGEAVGVSNIVLSFNDLAASSLPETGTSTTCTNGVMVGGTVKPSNYFKATPSEPTTLSALADGPANGQWRLVASTKNNIDVNVASGWGVAINSTDKTLAPTFASVSPTSPGFATLPVLRGTAEPLSTVFLYTDAECTAFNNSGSADAFSSLAGIAVAVPADSTTDIYALAIAPGKRASACSFLVTYVNDQTAPAAPTGLALSPASPGRTTTPAVTGSAEAGSTVSLFIDDCTGAPVATGPAADFAAAGLQVPPVVPNSTTTFRAKATDAAGNRSPCSNAITYVNDVSDPAPPSGLTVAPTSPDPSTTPVVTGVAEAGSTVRLYTTGDCAGAPVATGTAAVFGAAGLQVTVAAGSTTTFHATASDPAGNTSPCSTSSATYVNTQPPAPPSGLTVAPTSPGSSTTPVVTGVAEAGSTVRLYTTGDCAGAPVATGTAAVFGSTGLRVTVAAGSTTTFRATASDAAGNTSPCSTSSATYSHRPNTRLDKTPHRTVRTATRSTRVAFRFSSSTPGATFQCSMDGGTFRSCTSGEKFRVRLGKHRFAVRAKIAGRVDPTPATYSFRVVRR